MRRWTRGLGLVGATLGIVLTSACQSPRAILRTSGPTMQELITGARAGGVRTPGSQRPLSQAERHAVRAAVGPSGHAPATLAGYTRTAETEIAQLFPRHPNPQITIYVYPHLATENAAPVPGYTTAIPLYPVDPYALPGEQAMPRH